MEKLKMQTKNKVDVNVETIGSLFPNTITERIKEYDESNKPIVEKAIDFDILKQELSKVIVEGKEERYQMNWPGKKEAILRANSPINKTLRPCREESVYFDTTENLYIEGDNLEVLQLLQETYLNKVKMIYIDPPYNTGNDSFVYPDNFAMSSEEFSEISGQYDEDGNMNYDIRKNSESNGKFHTDWLNMMYPRLKLAKDLLSDDGCIFISIDDNEMNNIRKICDEIFGEANFIANLVWEKKKKGSFLAKTITNIKEYILVYCKSKEIFSGLIGEINTNQETYPCINASNKREIREIPKGIISKYKNENYTLSKGSIISVTTMNLVLHSDLVIENGILAKDLIIEGNWRYNQQSMYEYAINGELYLTQDLYLRRIVSDARHKPLKDLLPRIGKEKNASEEINIQDLFDGGWGSNEDADEELRKLMDIQGLINYPKPTKLITKIIASYRKKDFIILDFFSGSSTTSHAMMKLNAMDRGNRKFIMVQIPELTDEKSEAFKAGYKNICEIGKERIRRAGKKIKEENPDKADNLDIGFRVLKLDSSNMKDVFYNPTDFNQDMIEKLESNIKEDRSSEDLLLQVMLDLGELLSSDIDEIEIQGKKVFNVGQGNIIACFDDDITEEVVKEIAKMNPFYAVFRDSSLSNDSVATNFEQIFKTYSPNTIRKVL